MRKTCTRIPGRATALGALAALAFPLAACGGGDGDAGPDAPATVTTATPSTPPPVEPAAYRTTLDTTLGPLDKALRAVDSAREGGALNKALGAAATAATTAAAELDTAETPDDAVSGNASLADSLRDLSQSLDDARADEGRCATSPRVELNSADSLGTVRDAAGTLTGLGYTVRLKLPRTEKPSNRRLGNGSFVKDGRGSGLGRLTIKNSTDSDTVVSLTRGERTAFTVYIRKGSSTTVRRVRDGSYSVYFTAGADWNSSKRSFTRDCSFEKFDDKADFRTVQVSGGTQYTVLTFSLAKTIGGNATTSEVPEDEFPS
ncbi:hypothetical protein [Streptomyces sp. AK02-01A]|uniref:hypothetical protein n=1 Tax=Streptomyces sp. AK02-01A TaxID=3028648 RepID=UPI0029A4078F|nr:hypothetical protein [Streptomyces sp. AK02-01A]MDX3854581.1 hypothetical protein [Streptomyces sp. AK02-01A]